MNINTLSKFGLDETKAKQLFEQIQNYIKNEVEKKAYEEKLKYEKELLKLKQKATIETELLLAGARNIKATLALLDIDEISAEEFDINKIKEKIFRLKENENTKFLFFDKNDEIKLKGFKPFESHILKEKYDRNMNYEELCKYYEQMEQF